MTAASTSTTTTTTSCCPNCGLSLPPASEAQIALLQAQKQIEDLEAQVRLLNQKATAAVDRWADYEDELSRLRAASTTSVATNTTTTTSNNNNNNSSPRSSFLPTAASGAAARISQLLAPRKSVPNLATQRGSISAPAPVMPNGDDLLEALSRERELRAKAEGKLRDTSREVEELSATLFEQANEMVASERRARAKLEERVSVLERRDVEKRDRLDRLEGAMGRLDRVRALLEER
ncbi:putative ribosomal protein l32 protein [Daldinia childiae]|uniref:putative ribosomal protein l32 protein n=1 Tax=Daldinia childiae TaxID=326645 RepID=UPI0014480ACF|nr:putative ribosomal protein l32 protein [Daldinia childiae]KAF3069056.1 putative ribosomal protein l32 protein [Daldinia childiae]